jgi:hypothetical protein
MSVPDPSDDGVERPEDLYGLDPASFTAARNALAKRLRGGGDKAQAAEIAKLRRPPITAWALNQVARHEGALIDALGRAGDDLAAAMERALGGDASSVRDAQVQERVAVEAVLDAAAAHLDGVGHRPNEQARQRMAQTLRASLVDDAARAKLARGVLDADVDAVGFGLGDLSGFAVASPGAARAPEPQAPVGDEPAAPEPAAAAPEPAPAAPPEPDPEMVRRVDAARAQRDEQARAVDRARAEVEARQAVVEQRREEEAEARRRAEEAVGLLAEAEEAAREAVASLQQSEQRVDEAERALEDDRRR